MSIEVLKFSASWCNPCKVLANNLSNVDGITNIDVEENIELGAKYGVRKIPLIVFLKDGKEVGRSQGVITEEEYGKLLNDYTK
jgi:thioredoxin 1